MYLQIFKDSLKYSVLNTWIGTYLHRSRFLILTSRYFFLKGPDIVSPEYFSQSKFYFFFFYIKIFPMSRFYFFEVDIVFTSRYLYSRSRFFSSFKSFSQVEIFIFQTKWRDILLFINADNAFLWQHLQLLMKIIRMLAKKYSGCMSRNE